MTAQQLKNSILQMAVQGKLVPQDPNDEPASVLLERIKAEKEALIKSGKIKKSKKSSEIFRGASRTLPYAFCEQIGKEIRDISDEIPFKIPDSWEWVRLGVISSLVTKGTTPRGGNVSYLDSGIGFLKAENVAGMDVLDTSKMNYIDEETHNGFLKRSILYENDLLITIAGTLGRTAIVRKHNLPLNANQAVSIIRLVDSNEFDLMYLICALNSPLIQKMLTKQKKITAIPNLTLEIISDCFIPIPPLSEQKRIVAKIEGLLPFIEKYEQAETKLTALNKSFPEMLKKSILQEAVQGKLVPQNPDDEPASVLLERIRAEKQELIRQGKIKKSKHESTIVTRDKIPYEIPDTWVWCKLADICKSITDGDHQPPPQVPSGKPFIVISNVSGGTIDFSNTRYVSDEYYNNLDDNRKPVIDDILFTVTGSYGIVMKVNTDKEFCFQRHIALLKPLYVDSDFLVHWLRTPLVFEQCKATATGTAQKTVGLTSLKNILIPIPPLAEQIRIVAKIEELTKYCDKL